MNWLPLIGVPVIGLGFALRRPVSVIVLAAGVITGFATGMPAIGTVDHPGILDTLGKAFADYRNVSLFVLALPAVGLSERYGLQEQARTLVRSIGAATVGRVLSAYHFIRLAIVALGIRLSSGHVTFSRPLVVPMTLAAGNLEDSARSGSAEVETVKAAAGASDNYANFFGQNLFPASAGVGVLVNTLKAGGLDVSAWRVAMWTIPIAVLSTAFALVQYAFVDRWLRKRKVQERDRPVEDVVSR
jgi:uncharacterized membrane protein